MQERTSTRWRLTHFIFRPFPSYPAFEPAVVITRHLNNPPPALACPRISTAHQNLCIGQLRIMKRPGDHLDLDIYITVA